MNTQQREVYYCATIKLASDNIVRLHQKKTYPYLAAKYDKKLSPKSKIYASNINDLIHNLNSVLRSLVLEFIEKRDLQKNAHAQVELSRIIKEIRKVRRELKQEKLMITTTY
jgi:hypothetical protein